MNEEIVNLVANFEEEDLKKAFIAAIIMNNQEMEIEKAVELAGDIPRLGALNQDEFYESVREFLNDIKEED